MKEILNLTQTGEKMVTRYALTQKGVTVSTFRASNVNRDLGMTDQEYDMLMNSDYPYECAAVVSEQTNWLNVEVTVYNKIALYKPKLEVLNPFSKATKLLIMSNHNVIKTFDVGNSTGVIEFDFLKNDKLVNNPEDPEDKSKYFESNGCMAYTIDDYTSPIIINPYSIASPTTVTVNLVGNIDPAASGVFRMSVCVPKKSKK